MSAKAGTMLFCTALGLFAGSWLGTTFTALTVAASCELDGEYRHHSWVFKPNAIRVSCAAASQPEGETN